MVLLEVLNIKTILNRPRPAASLGKDFITDFFVKMLRIFSEQLFAEILSDWFFKVKVDI